MIAPTVFNAIFQHQFRTFLAGLPPGRHGASRGLAAKVGELFVRLVEDGVLLLDAHGGGVLVRVTMETTFFRSGAKKIKK